MTIIFVIGQLSVGGSEKYILKLITGLNDGSYDIHVICLSNKLALKFDMEQKGATVHIINPNKFKKIRSIWQLHILFRKINADIIHTVGRSWYYTIPSSIFIKSKIFVSSHSIPSWKKWFHKLADKILLRKVSMYIANADRVKKETWENIGMPNKNATVIYIGLDTKEFDLLFNQPIANPIQNTIYTVSAKPILTLVAGLSPVKSIDTAILAQKYIIKTYPKCQLWIVGEGRCREKLEKLVKEEKLENNVSFWGNRHDIPALLAATDIGILSSKREGLPTSITEYMAAKLPVISTDVGAIKEQVVHNVTGILVAKDDPVALSNAIRDLLENPAKMKEMGLNGRKIVENIFPIQKMITSHKVLYESYK